MERVFVDGDRFLDVVIHGGFAIAPGENQTAVLATLLDSVDFCSYQAIFSTSDGALWLPLVPPVQALRLFVRVRSVLGGLHHTYEIAA